MLVVVSYDVQTSNDEGKRRHRRVAKICEDFGQRVQGSVFECLVDTENWVCLRTQLLAAYRPEADSLRFYFLGTEWKGRVEHHGTKPIHDPEGPLVV